tara:strand:+ start:2205 stop:2702 length:498 start_codon:yes stop_codon:yes gene_type:complete
MTLIRHFTKPQFVQPILSDGIINKERSNSFEKQEKSMKDYYGEVVPMSREAKEANIRGNNFLSSVIGDFVWFTEERFANTALPKVMLPTAKDLYFEFDSEEIGAIKWHHFKKRFTEETALSVIRVMDKAAKLVGDNPYCYWISESAVPIALAKPKGIMLPIREAA